MLQELRGEGFEPFMVCQTRVRFVAYRTVMVSLNHQSRLLPDGLYHLLWFRTIVHQIPEHPQFIVIALRRPQECIMVAMHVGNDDNLHCPKVGASTICLRFSRDSPSMRYASRTSEGESWGLGGLNSASYLML